jgi:hypothetical protein
MSDNDSGLRSRANSSTKSRVRSTIFDMLDVSGRDALAFNERREKSASEIYFAIPK